MAITIASTADPAGVTHVSNVTTYATTSIGNAAADRIVAVCVQAKVAQTVTKCTISQGAGDVLMNLAASGIFSTCGAFIYQTLVPAQTTASINITWTGAVTSQQNHITVFSVTGADTAPLLSLSDSTTDTDATDPCSVTQPAVSVALACVATADSTSARTWAGATAVVDASGGLFRYSSAFSTTASTNVKCTGGTNLEDGAMAFVAFQNPSSLAIRSFPRSIQPILAQ